MFKKSKPMAVIVAHPDDEILWVGGTLMDRSSEDCFILCLCRGSDPDRAPKFKKALKRLGASGLMADLEDGPSQNSLPGEVIARTLRELLPHRKYGIIYTHSPLGEYTRHIRHEETGREVLNQWLTGRLSARELRLFAYDDSKGKGLPGAIPDAPIQHNLSEKTWMGKYGIITELYGFPQDSFEAETTPRIEAFWPVRNKKSAECWLNKARIE